ncbi:MAG: hypothetical protein M3143_02390 [Actinomycetota bacterium]|nr:hypothetical protein [Actinomycetota bacterium]
MLLNARELDGIAAGQVSLVFRRWQRAGVKASTRQRTRIGVVAIDSVDVLAERMLTDTDAQSAGHRDRVGLLKALSRYGDGDIHRIQLHLAGPDPRIALRERADLTAAEVAELRITLSQMDNRSSVGPWTLETLRMIAEQPGVRAPYLASSVWRETKPFKIDVRKLKELGLTESLPIGYRPSPRGRVFLGHIS